MSRNQIKSKTGQDRYNSKARRILIPQFRLLKVQFLEPHDEAKLGDLRLPDYIFAEGTDGYYPSFPVIIQGNGEPWEIGNLYLTTKLQRESSYESRTFRGIADHLLDYLRFLEDEGLNYLYLPSNNRLRATFRYKKRLIELRDDSKISASTASTRINAIVNFYRGILSWGLIREGELENIPFEEIVKNISIISEIGTENKLKIKSHSLAIKVSGKPLQSEYINDGGSLRPLTVNEQECILKALLSSSREYQLMFYFSLFTGARIQTVGTLRIKHLHGKLDGNGYLRLPIGNGTSIDTKRGRQMMLLVPGWLVRDMLIYTRSPEAIKRRTRSFYSDTEDNYLFLSKNGVPYYTSKKELLDRRDAKISRYAHFKDRVLNYSIQDGAALRQHIRDILFPRIYIDNPDFQNFTFHDLRATFGMNLLESQLQHLGDKAITAALDYVQQRMGHRDKTTTLQYLNYKSRLEWKACIQHEFEQKLFTYINSASS
ncbi:site-specific integrase [Pseudomonas sp. TNT2022 ID1044]|uniref:tyrosine-type recombinase/integrase n=1 Tax=Pseudomonas sp. TNT2022 ID1044 TaxID=2942636 RepID=UPI00235FA31D|nr:tyrosine-type recombinase/integrase [Pseudomonas sp. TNT2022 ID1044]MDD0998447.1 site-specific integrase [Pseudomonas sp. TNT2022 ID1044]